MNGVLRFVLKQHFQKKLINKFQGFGFVTMQNPDDADRARAEFNGTTIEGRRVEVNLATQRVHNKKAKPLMSGKENSVS